MFSVPISVRPVIILESGSIRYVATISAPAALSHERLPIAKEVGRICFKNDIKPYENATDWYRRFDIENRMIEVRVLMNDKSSALETRKVLASTITETKAISRKRATLVNFFLIPEEG